MTLLAYFALLALAVTPALAGEARAPASDKAIYKVTDDTYSSYDDAQCACNEMRSKLVDVTLSNIQTIAQIVRNAHTSDGQGVAVVGGITNVWIGSWNGDAYDGAIGGYVYVPAKDPTGTKSKAKMSISVVTEPTDFHAVCQVDTSPSKSPGIVKPNVTSKYGFVVVGPQSSTPSDIVSVCSDVHKIPAFIGGVQVPEYNDAINVVLQSVGPSANAFIGYWQSRCATPGSTMIVTASDGKGGTVIDVVNQAPPVTGYFLCQNPPKSRPHRRSEL